MTIKTTDEWVSKVNALARDIEGWASALHPSVWKEQLGDAHTAFRELCAQQINEQLSLPGMEIE